MGARGRAGGGQTSVSLVWRWDAAGFMVNSVPAPSPRVQAGGAPALHPPVSYRFRTRLFVTVVQAWLGAQAGLCVPAWLPSESPLRMLLSAPRASHPFSVLGPAGPTPSASQNVS